MNLLSAENLTKSAGDRTLFADFSFGLDRGDKVGLIGMNGSGKSTLLRLLAGIEAPDAGQVTLRGGVRRSFLPQSPTADPGRTILEQVFEGDSPRTALVRAYERACALQARGADNAGEIDRLEAEMDAADAWNYEHAIRAMLHRLGLEDLSLSMGALSGGMVKKTSLAQVLIDEADILLLDEPTNHLDIETVHWLEGELQRSTATVVLVTHDRYFLENVVSRIFEIEDGSVQRYPGNYTAYLERKAEEDEQRQRESSRAKSVLRGELEWLNRQPKARGTKSKARIERVEQIKNRIHQQSTGSFEFSAHGRPLGKKVLSVVGVAAARGDRTLFSDLTHHFRRSERIGVVGPNGAGKTTLLEVLAGTLAPSAGKVSPGVNTQVAMFSQTDRELPGDRRVLQFVREQVGHTAAYGKENVRLETGQLLEMFRLNPAMTIGRLSGGERRRLQLVALLAGQPNFLILDEPSNDLDTATLALLEEFLLGFPGCLVVASHDRWFMDRLTDMLLIVGAGETIQKFPGNFSEYLEFRAEDARAEAGAGEGRSGVGPAGQGRDSDVPGRSVPEEPAGRAPARGRNRKLGFNEGREFAALEEEIPELERRKHELEEQLNSGAGDYRELERWGLELTQLTLELDQKTERWLALSERRGD